jgi:predicted transposase YdaD
MAGGIFDRFTKELFRESGKELVAWLTGVTPLEVEPVRTELVIAEARQADEIVRVRLPGDPSRVRYLHVEVQTRGHRDMPRRMREYWSRAERILSEQPRGKGTRKGRAAKLEVRLSSFVVYLSRKTYRADPGKFRYRDEFGTACLFCYRVIKIWELDPATVYRLRTPSLVPWAPLMKTADPVATMIKSREIIRAWNPSLVPAEKKASLQAALAVFSGLVIENMDMLSELLKLDRKWIEQSVVVKEWKRQSLKKGRAVGRKVGRKEGRLLARREDLLSVLQARFGAVGAAMEAAIFRIKDARRLRDLHARAVVVPSLADFVRELRG